MTKLIIIMIGLPARGKSYISQKLYRYYSWKGLISKIFNVAVDLGFLPETHANPAHKVKPYEEKARDRYVTKDELPRLTKAMDNSKNFY